MKIKDYPGVDIFHAFIVMQAFTGHETVSAFTGRGKIRPLYKFQ